MRNNRTAGNNYERTLAQEYRDLGFDKAATSRYVSRERDDAKVDLCYTVPFNVQAKYTKNYPNMFSLLDEMPKDNNFNVIHHKKNIGVGKTPEEIVVLKKEDWFEIIKILKGNKII